MRIYLVSQPEVYNGCVVFRIKYVIMRILVSRLPLMARH